MSSRFCIVGVEQQDGMILVVEIVRARQYQFATKMNGGPTERRGRNLNYESVNREGDEW